MKSGDRVIVEKADDGHRWIEGFAGVIVNVYRTRASVNVCVNPGNFRLISLKNLTVYNPEEK